MQLFLFASYKQYDHHHRQYKLVYLKLKQLFNVKYIRGEHKKELKPPEIVG